MEAYLKIGETADMFDISIRALRLYDKIGLLKPGYTDVQTGYRYYTADQLRLLNAILVLKAVGVRLADIKHLVDNGINPGELIEVMAKKQEFWENQIEIARFNIENIKKIKAAAESKLLEETGSKRPQPDAYKMASLVCLENYKLEGILSEALWL
jgi:DNA-binding transcriptional MerR regulator